MWLNSILWSIELIKCLYGQLPQLEALLDCFTCSQLCLSVLPMCVIVVLFSPNWFTEAWLLFIFLMPIWFPSVEVVGVFGVRRCWEYWMVAPVVACSCCVGLAPAHAAAVWLSVWAAGVTGRPFTPARTAIRSPSPSVLAHSASSPLHHFCLFLNNSLPLPISTTRYPFYPPSVCPSLPHHLPSIFFLHHHFMPLIQ